MIKWTINQEDITIIFIYLPNLGAPTYIKQSLKDLKGQNDNYIRGPEYPIERNGLSKQKVNKEISALNDTLGQMDITNINSTFHPQTTEYTFFLSAHGTFSRVYHILVHKTSPNYFKNIDVIPSVFSDHSGMILNIKYKKKAGKNTNM